MKRHEQTTGVRKWSGDDLVELQGEPLAVLDGFFSQYGNTVIKGCTVSGGAIASGIVAIGGKVMPFAGATDITTYPIYLEANVISEQREYVDGVTKDIAKIYEAVTTQTKPSGDYIEIPSDGSFTKFFDQVDSTWLTDLKTRLAVVEAYDKEVVFALSTVTSLYDVVIRTQEQFEDLIASEDWLGACSVAFVGDGGELKFTKTNSTSDYSGIVIPQSVKSIIGYNRATIRVENYLGGDKGVLMYAESVDDTYSLSGINVECVVCDSVTTNGEQYISAFYNCYRIWNCDYNILYDGSVDIKAYQTKNCTYLSEGKDTVASADSSHAEGDSTEATANKSHAEGEGSVASGIISHAEGKYTTASGSASHTEGRGTIAGGTSTHAEGLNSESYGDNSHAEGEGTIARGKNQTVFGAYNIEDTNNEYAEIVGGGTSSIRKNTRTLDWNGNQIILGSNYQYESGSTPKKMATEEYVNNAVDNIDVSDQLVYASADVKGMIRISLQGDELFIYTED